MEGYATDDCSGTIDVRAGTISEPTLAVSHLFIVFTDSHGVTYAFRGGPDHIGEGYGHTRTRCAPYNEDFVDWDPSAPSERVYEGDDACNKAQCFREQLARIAATDTPYLATGPNSNSVIAGLLLHCGLPVRKPNVTAPGFNMEITDEGAHEVSEARERRHRLGLTLGGRISGLSDYSAGLNYSVDLAEALNWTLRFPLTLGTEFLPGSSGVLGSASIGVEAPFLNIPLPGGGRIPTTLGASLGVIGGVTESGVPGGGMDPLLGMEIIRPYIGLDMGRFRVSPFYRLEWLRNLETDSDLFEHLFGLEVGATF